MNKNIGKNTENWFLNPNGKYRSYPFWAWNGRLDNSRLEEQISGFKKMGFGGFFMHSRPGLETDYLSEDFFDAIDCSVKKAKELGMKACLYDEDRWPSGFAGGIVTKIRKYRQRFLKVTSKKDELPEFTEKTAAIEEGKPYLIGCYDVKLSSDGYLEEYRPISEKDRPEFVKYYAYSVTDKPSGRYNLQTFADIFQKDTIKYFTDITHGKYFARFNDEYGKTIPMMFSDEPRQGPVIFSGNEAVLYWSFTFEDTFKNRYGYNLADVIPEVLWDKRQCFSKARYDFYNNATECFKEAFFEQIHGILSSQGLLFCGHLMLENELTGQLGWGGDLMRLYPCFDIPGVDMLFDNVELMNIKQVQSVVRQYAKKGMLSELYGVVGWDIDYKIIKMQGDWQIAFGVDIRVPHLSMYTMKGCAKRDYPASINYQTPLTEDFSLLEDHFARLTAALDGGKDISEVAILHPMDTVMLEYGISENKTKRISALEKSVKSILNTLLYNNIDCDFISEANLPAQGAEISSGLKVGQMSYSAVIVPPIDTIRKTTLDVLNGFLDNGGTVIFTGKCPDYLDGVLSKQPSALYGKALHISDLNEIKKRLENLRNVSIETEGEENKIIHRLCEKNGEYWLFAAHCEQMGKFSPARTYTSPKKVKIEVKGEYGVTVYNTVAGCTEKADYEIKGSKTVIYRDWYANDSLLLKLTRELTEKAAPESPPEQINKITVNTAELKRQEPNCIVLDICSMSLNGERYGKTDYILNQNLILGKKFQIPNIEVQPYIIKKPGMHIIKTKYEFASSAEISGLKLVLENPEDCKIKFNGKEIPSFPDGYYVDKDFLTVNLGSAVKGKNILEAEQPVDIVRKLEPMFIIGEFDAKVNGAEITLLPVSDSKNIFVPLKEIGMPFYGGNISYKSEFYSEDCIAKISVSEFAAPYIRVSVDGERKGIIAFSPFTVRVPLKSGRHELELVCMGNRNNTFGTIHNRKMAEGSYRASWDCWAGKDCTNEYHLQPVGISGCPEIRFFRKTNY